MNRLGLTYPMSYFNDINNTNDSKLWREKLKILCAKISNNFGEINNKSAICEEPWKTSRQISKKLKQFFKRHFQGLKKKKQKKKK